MRGNSEFTCIKIMVVILLLLSKNATCSSFDSVHLFLLFMFREQGYKMNSCIKCKG